MNAASAPSLDNPRIDKKGAELDRQRFRMLQDIARELSGEVIFPTSFDAVMRLRKALQDPDISLAKLAALITIEPLINARLLALANSAAYNPGGNEIRNLQKAIERLGLQTVRSAALAIAMKQLIMARGVVAFQSQSDRLWQHSLRTASAAWVIARRLTRVNPDDALLTGMVHDIGAFYMIYRAAQYEELILRPDTTRYLITRWHESIGHALIIALGLPVEVADAAVDHDQPRPIPESPKNLADILFVANLLAEPSVEWLDPNDPAQAGERDKLESYRSRLGDEIDQHQTSLKAAFD